MDDVESSLVEYLGAHWNVSGVISEYEPGSLSRAWRVDTPAGPVVAKLARNTLAHFALGLRISEVVDAAGITSGKPIRTIDGEVAVTTNYGSLAVLEHVPGRPARLEDIDVGVLGRLLGRIHVATSVLDSNGAWTLDDVAAHTRAGLLGSQPTWVQDFVLDALARVEAWTPPRCQLLRGDGPGLLVADGQISGMIDWGATRWGSVADDIGCWTVHLGLLHGGYQLVTADFAAAYRSVAPLTADEERAIALFQQLRLATRPPYTTDPAALDRMKAWIDGWQAERK